MIGVIRWWSPDRGCGMARPENGPDVFVHHSALADDGDLRPGQTIEFDIIPGYVGAVAANVHRI